GSRWRPPDARRDRPAGARGRVAAAQAQARPTLRLALVFVVAGAVAAALPATTGRWLPLHLFLAGALALAISGATQLFAVTWAAAPAPNHRAATAQRWLVAAGAAGVAVTREVDASRALVATAGVV